MAVVTDGITIGGDGTIPTPITSLLPGLTPLIISGTVNGTNLSFTMSFDPNPDSSIMLWDGPDYQVQGVDYNVSGTSLTFVSGRAPSVLLTGFAGLSLVGSFNFVNVATVSAMRSISNPNSSTIYYLSAPGQQGPFYYDPTDTTTADNTGLCLVSSTYRFKRIYYGSVNVQWFGVVADAVFSGLLTVSGTDNTAALQLAVDSVFTQRMGATLFFPKGRYLINGTVYIMPVYLNRAAMTLEGDQDNARLTYNPGAENLYTGTVLCRNVTGDMFRVNMDSSGNTTLLPATITLYNSFSIKNISFAGGQVSEVSGQVTGMIAVKVMSTRIKIENCSIGNMDWLMYQPLTDTLGSQTYCDQGIYRNLYINNPLVGGLFLSYSDGTLIENVNQEMGIANGSNFMSMIHVNYASGMVINAGVIWASYSNTYTVNSDSARYIFEGCDGVSVTGIHSENILEVESLFNLKDCSAMKFIAIHNRFDSNNTFTISGSNNISIDCWRTQDAHNSGFYDINFVGSGNRNVTWQNISFNTPPPGSTSRNISTSGIRGAYKTPSDDTVVTATDADYTVLGAFYLVILPTITANRVLNVPSALNYSGQPIRIWNRNTSGFTWSIPTGVNADVKNPDGSNITVLANNTVYDIEGYSANWIRI